MSKEPSKITTIAITMGDYNGVGPEVVMKALSWCYDKLKANFLIIGSAKVFLQIQEILKSSIKLQPIYRVNEISFNKNHILLFDIFKEENLQIQYGILSKEAGFAAAKSIETGIQLALDGMIDALITAPVSKEALVMAGYRYPGQTEMLADFSSTRYFAMMLMSGTFRVGLVTTHCAVSQISNLITKKKVIEKIQTIHSSLRNDFKIENPKIAVTSLNPHGGESGIFGTEESNQIMPAIQQALKDHIQVSGPFPADTLFANIEKSDYDAYLAMYHDQGLIPLKMRAFGKGVNFTAGLPFIRTSPDHGTAFDIADKMIANESSMIEAINIGYQLAKKRITG